MHEVAVSIPEPHEAGMAAMPRIVLLRQCRQEHQKFKVTVG